MRRTCQVFGVEKNECSQLAVDFVELCYERKVWMCAEHWDDYTQAKPVWENPATRQA